MISTYMRKSFPTSLGVVSYTSQCLLSIILFFSIDRKFVCLCRWCGEVICKQSVRSLRLHFEYFSTACNLVKECLLELRDWPIVIYAANMVSLFISQVLPVRALRIKFQLPNLWVIRVVWAEGKKRLSHVATNIFGDLL